MQSTRPTRLAAGAAAVVAVGTLAAGCGTGPAPQLGAAHEIRGVAAVQPLVSPRPYAAADLAFGLDLLGAWCRQEPAENIVLSPSSLASGLGMAYLGASGSTAQAMARVLHLPASGSIEAGLQARSRALGRLDGSGVTVATADRVWADPKLLPRRSYLNAVATSYRAGIGRVPLLTDPARAARQIDAAIAAATKGHITNLLSAQAAQGAIFVLTDALYLKARWADPFPPRQTTTGRFVTAAGQRVQARYLNNDVTSASDSGWTAVSLPYQGGKLSMTALLPPAPVSVSTSPATAGRSAPACPYLSPVTLAALTRKLNGPRSRINPLSLPEINLRTQADLRGLLTKLGMGVAFAGDADFSRMSSQVASLGPVEHAATLRVDAQGTVATAATAAVAVPVDKVATPHIVFDRPYLLLISAAGSSEPLFLARVANPDEP
jgi:serine protease inhibitor